jgi:hypothetical protein
MKKLIKVIVIVSLLPGCLRDDDNLYPPVAEINFSFDTGTDGWIAGYSDYPANLTANDSLILYEMSYGHSLLPDIPGPPQYGFRIRGHNRSDDLFMYIKRKVSGLSPNTTYSLSFDIELASNVPTGAIGIGGPPGEAVTLKAGAKEFEPKNTTDGLNWYRLNIDKGNQSAGGTDVIILGNIGVSDTTTVYSLINRKSTTPIQRVTSSNGELWLIIGTDSGFEGLTELYYSKIRIELRK